MSSRLVFWYSFLITLLCCFLAIVFMYWGYWKAVYPICILGMIASIPISYTFFPKSKLNWSGTLVLVMYMTVLIFSFFFNINEKEHSFIAIYSMLSLLGLIALGMLVLEIYTKCKHKTFIAKDNETLQDSNIE